LDLIVDVFIVVKLGFDSHIEADLVKRITELFVNVWLLVYLHQSVNYLEFPEVYSLRINVFVELQHEVLVFYL
jgi:hypothetical protein